MKQIELHLKNKSVKPTAMRLLVLQFFTEQTKAVSLKNLEIALAPADKSTLFRTLRTFEKIKLSIVLKMVLALQNMLYAWKAVIVSWGIYTIIFIVPNARILSV